MIVKRSVESREKFSIRFLRIVLIAFTVLGFLTVFSTVTFAWFTGVTINRSNKITTSKVALKLMTTDNPLNYSETTINSVNLSHPKTTGELFTNGNTLISLDDNENGNRKFFEYNGKNSIEDVQSNFRQLRPLIVMNDSTSTVNYTIDFISKETCSNGLGSAFFFNYTKVSEDIPNQSLTTGDTSKLTEGETVTNLGTNITKIGLKSPIALGAKSSHIYMVNLGILQTASTSYQSAQLEVDIILAANQGGDTVHSIKDLDTFKKAIVENKGGDSFVLTNDVTINEALISNNVFNLNLNGYTLKFEVDGVLQVIYPITPATMDIGSDNGGKVEGASSILFTGKKNKSVLNWYSDITGLDSPVASTDVIINVKKMENSSSSNPTSSETNDQFPDYLDYNSIVIADTYASGNGADGRNPFLIETIEQFKKFVEDDTTTSSTWIMINTDIWNIKNVPKKLIEKSANLIFSNGISIQNIDILSDIPATNPPNPFCNSILFNANGVNVNYITYINNISYNGVKATN